MSNSLKKIRKNLAKFGLVEFPDPLLHQECEEVNPNWIGTEEYYSLVRRMRLTNSAEKGVAVAAPQVGSQKRLFYYNVAGDEGVIINPEIISHSENHVPYNEGCLSIRGYWWEIMRPDEITVQFLDHHGELRQAHVDDIHARVFQHEIDHLNGTLIVDYLDDEQYDKFEEEYFNLEKRTGKGPIFVKA